MRIVLLDGNQNHSSKNRSSTYSNALGCRLSRLSMIKNNVIGHRRTYSNALGCRLSRLAMIKNNVIGHRRTYSNTFRCGLSRLAMIKNNVIGHRRTYSNAFRCGLSRLAMNETQVSVYLGLLSTSKARSIAAPATISVTTSSLTLKQANTPLLSRHIEQKIQRHSR